MASTAPTMSHDDEILLRVSDLAVVLDGVRVVSDVSFLLRRGEILTVLGPNGAGKTVLLRALLGTVPHHGTIAWKPGTRVGYVPQRLPYIRNTPLSVREFFALKPTARVDPHEVLRDVGLPEGFADRRVGELSSGQFQRTLIAWALAGDPDALLFDEPTTGIDLGGEETVYSLLSRLQRERALAMIVITHDLSVVHRLSSEVLCLNRRPLCQGPPVQILTPENLRRLYGQEVTFYEHKHGGPG
jgi:zinc transport system ATP-binding protein